jgi:hypothetical protein
MRERKVPVTLKASRWEIQRWEEVGRRVRRDLPGFLVFSANAAARYLLELEHQRRPDYVMIREEEKKKLGALYTAAKAAVGHVPKIYDSPIHGRLFLQAPLQTALDELSRWLAWTGEEYPCE